MEATATATAPAEIMSPLARLEHDVKLAGATLSRDEARFLVDAYYIWQEQRKRSDNQVRALTDSKEPHEVIQWLSGNASMLEQSIKRVLEVFSSANPLGVWAKSIVGIGPVIAAGLLAHIDIEQAPTVGHIWRFAGLDPTRTWTGREAAAKMVRDAVAQTGQSVGPPLVTTLAITLGVDDMALLRWATTNNKGETVNLTAKTLAKAIAKRPWNASLKTLCWKIGESFVKVSGRDDDIYGHVWAERKAQEEARSEAGQFTEQAAVGAERVGKSTEAYKHYSQGKLPPGHLHARSKRYAVKLFLSHYQHVAYELRFGEPPPKPYVLTQEGHAHFLGPPNWPMG